MINADQEQRWRSDLSAARAAHQTWLLTEGQDAHRRARAKSVVDVERMLDLTSDLRTVTPEILRRNPSILATQRMSTAPPLARERLAGLARAEKSVVLALEQDRLPGRMSPSELDAQLARICRVIRGTLDPDLFSWLGSHDPPAPAQRRLAVLAVANRLCDSLARDFLRQACRRHDLGLVQRWLTDRGYSQGSGPLSRRDGDATFTMGPGPVALPGRPWSIAADVIIRPPEASRPVVVLTSIHRADGPSVRRPPSEVAAWSQATGRLVRSIHLLSGPVELPDLRSLAARGQDWIWAHRLHDLEYAHV